MHKQQKFVKKYLNLQIRVDYYLILDIHIHQLQSFIINFKEFGYMNI